MRATAQAYRPDAVLLDIGLPVMDGYEVASCMRRVEGLSKLIAVTGWARRPTGGVQSKPASTSIC
jgi:CheY-like chemotaxis protein